MIKTRKLAIRATNHQDAIKKDRGPDNDRSWAVTRLLIGLAAFGVLSGVAVAWQVTPLRDWVDLGQFLDRVRALGNSPVAVIVVLAAYPVSGLLMLPTTLIILASLALFGPLWGFIYAILGCLLNALAFYGLGRVFARRSLGFLFSRQLDQVTAMLAGHEILAVAAVNWSQVVNLMLSGLAAGVLRIGFGRYSVGTLLGTVPGIIVLTIFEDRPDKAIHQPTTVNVVGLIAVAIFWLFAAIWCARRLVKGWRHAR
ncbi:MAG: TVP38/TMEM64 family protein [Alphaproteobacteria bacterium]|nr:TVP38/TMEM64 family protein [Alphaproteobacteria bacterium]